MPTPAPSALAGLRILVVDDEFMVAEYIQMLLEDADCIVVGPVPTIKAALEAIASERLDGVLLDANLGGKSSAPIAAELADRGIPFVVVTGYGRLGLPAGALNDAPRLSKPIGEQELAKTLAATFLGH